MAIIHAKLCCLQLWLYHCLLPLCVKRLKKGLWLTWQPPLDVFVSLHLVCGNQHLEKKNQKSPNSLYLPETFHSNTNMLVFFLVLRTKFGKGTPQLCQLKRKRIIKFQDRIMKIKEWKNKKVKSWGYYYQTWGNVMGVMHTNNYLRCVSLKIHQNCTIHYVGPRKKSLSLLLCQRSHFPQAENCLQFEKSASSPACLLFFLVVTLVSIQ